MLASLTDSVMYAVPCCAVLCQGVTKTSRKERLAAKFVEAEFEKVDRLMEIAFRCAVW
jgi:hypothetical protein